MKCKKFRLGFRGKLTIFFVLFAVLPLLAGGIWTFVGEKKQVIEIEYEKNYQTADRLGGEIDQLIKSKLDFARTLANLPQALSMNGPELSSMLKSVKQQNKDIDVAAVTDGIGMQIARSDDGDLVNMGDRSYIKEIMAGKSYAVSEVLIGKTSGKPIVVVAAPIKENSNLKGAVYIAISLDSLGDMVSAAGNGENGYSYIVDTQGKVVAHPDEQYSKEQKELTALSPVQAGLSGKNGFTTFSGGGNTWLAGYVQTPFLKWVVVSQENMEEVNGETSKLLIKTGVVLLLSVLIALLAGIYFSQRVVRPVLTIEKGVMDMAGGDLSRVIEVRSQDEIGRLAGSVNTMRDNFRYMVQQLVGAGYQLSGSAGHLSSQAHEISAGASEAAATAGEVASTVEQVSKSLRELSSISGKAAQEAQAGVRSVETLTDRMHSMISSSNEATGVIHSLSVTLTQINQIVELITSIADQTNLLALNAAIEAARAGEQGRGFAVVAEEVRKLAEQSASAAKDINQMIGKVQDESSNAVAAMTTGNDQVKEGAIVMEEVGRNFNRIIDAVGGLAQQAQSLATAAEQVSGGVQDVASTTEEQTAAMEEVAAATGQLTKMSSELNNLAGRFKI